jgi:hypothetical protein
MQAAHCGHDHPFDALAAFSSGADPHKSRICILVGPRCEGGGGGWAGGGRGGQDVWPRGAASLRIGMWWQHKELLNCMRRKEKRGDMINKKLIECIEKATWWGVPSHYSSGYTAIHIHLSKTFSVPGSS